MSQTKVIRTTRLLRGVRTARGRLPDRAEVGELVCVCIAAALAVVIFVAEIFTNPALLRSPSKRRRARRARSNHLPF